MKQCSLITFLEFISCSVLFIYTLNYGQGFLPQKRHAFPRFPQIGIYSCSTQEGSWSVLMAQRKKWDVNCWHRVSCREGHNRWMLLPENDRFRTEKASNVGAHCKKDDSKWTGLFASFGNCFQTKCAGPLKFKLWRINMAMLVAVMCKMLLLWPCVLLWHASQKRFRSSSVNLCSLAVTVFTLKLPQWSLLCKMTGLYHESGPAVTLLRQGFLQKRNNENWSHVQSEK